MDVPLPHYRRSLVWAGIFLALFSAVTYGVVNLVLDPYGEYNLFSNPKFEDDHYSGAYKAYDHLEKGGPYDLIFGTSNSSTLAPSMLKAPLLNLSNSVYGRPENVYAFLAGLDQRQWDHIGRIYFMLDVFALTEKGGDYQDRDFHSAHTAPAFA